MFMQERSPPCVDDFLYICDDAYKREELITTEASILQTLSFDINIPIPYRFLRRYAKVCVCCVFEECGFDSFVCKDLGHCSECEHFCLLRRLCLLFCLCSV